MRSPETPTRVGGVLAPAGSLLLLVATLAACSLTDPDIKLDYVGYAPVALSDGWTVSTPADEGLDAAALDQVYRSLFSQERFPTARSLLVVRHGRLVAEAYCRDRGDRDRPHPLQSATKSITSLLMGIALDAGLVDSVGAPVYAYIPEHFDDDVQKRAITIRDVLTMRTGLAFYNDDDTAPFYNSTGSSLRYVLGRGLNATPGTTFWYSDGDPQLISGVVQATTGQTLAAFAGERLFDPLGITDYRWERHADGHSFGAFGLWLRPRDMAKIGELMVQDGAWGGQQVVSAQWIAESTRWQVPEQEYGYYWWVGEENAEFNAYGHGAQVILASPARDLVVVLTADPYSSDASLSPGLLGLFDGIDAAIVDLP